MAGNTNFPTSLDDNTSLIDVTNGVTALEAAHHNNLKEAIKALETKVGVDFTLVPTTLDYRLGHPTNGHRHDGASGQGPRLHPSVIQAPSGAYPSGAADLYAHLLAPHAAAGGTQYFIEPTTAILSATRGWQLPIPRDTIYAQPVGTQWPYTYVYLEDDTAMMAGYSYLELNLNAGNPGGKYYTKHWLIGGWGVLLPGLATSAIHATYSAEGQVYYDTVADKIKLWTGATWRSLAME